MKASGLRGRGGAGFPTGLKWSFMPKEIRTAGRAISSSTPTSPSPAPARTARSCATIRIKLIEGCLIAGFAMGAHACYIYVRGEFIRERERLQAAVDEAYAGRPDRQEQHPRLAVRLYVHHGAGAYICGEETALLESLEGKKGQPRLKPPFPANIGLYGCPTTVNNVESIAVAPTSCAAARRGSPASAGRTTPAPSCSASPAT
jgi:NADH-quinone oxidoreductase subunit F